MRYRRRLSQAGLSPLLLLFSWSPGPSDVPELWVVSERCTVKLPQAASLQPSKLLYHHNPTCSKEKTTPAVLSYALPATATSQLIRCPKSVTSPLVLHLEPHPMFSSTSVTSRGVIRTLLLATIPLQTSTILAPAKPREDRANTTGFSVANLWSLDHRPDFKSIT
jgi:hypothetical protein